MQTVAVGMPVGPVRDRLEVVNAQFLIAVENREILSERPDLCSRWSEEDTEEIQRMAVLADEFQWGLQDVWNSHDNEAQLQAFVASWENNLHQNRGSVAFQQFSSCSQ